MLQSFHNTIQSDGAQLAMFENTANMQQDRVLDIFQLNAHRSLTTREVHTIYITKYDELRKDALQTPHDSIKRAITNLTRQKELIKNSKEEMVPGPYNKQVFTWKLNKELKRPNV